MTGARNRKLATLHAWTGVVIALPLLLIALTGACLLFKDSLFVPRDWRASSTLAPQVQRDAEIARLLLHGGLQDVESIQLGRGVRDFHVISNFDGTTEYWRIGSDGPQSQIPARLKLEPWFLKLHEHLLLGVPGDYFVRTLGPAVAVLMVVGFVLWWPVRFGWQARDLVPRSTGRPQLLRAHLALGAALGLLYFTHASTGAMMANNPALRAWLKPLTSPSATAVPAGATLDFPTQDSTAALRAVRTIFPEGPVTQLSRAKPGPASSWSLKLRLPGENHPNGRSTVALNLAEGRLESIRDARKAGAPGLYDDIVFALHTGVLFGSWQRLLWLAGALSLTTLVAAGFISFLRRRRSPQGSPRRSH